MLAAAQPEITWQTLDGGGGTSTGGVYAVSGTIGQPDAGVSAGGEVLDPGIPGGRVARQRLEGSGVQAKVKRVK